MTGPPTLSIDIDRVAAARYGLSIERIQSVIQTALAGTEAREVLEGDRRFELVVRLPELPVPVEAKPRSLLATPTENELAPPVC